MRRLFLIPILAFALGGCAGRDSEAEYPSDDALSAEAETFEADEDDAEAARPAPPPGTLWRDEVHSIVDAGLGWFLQRVDVEAALEAGRFRGFRVVRLKPADFWQGVDLKPGDVVLSVNGMSIEHETEAYGAFQSLKKSDELRVKYVRGGSERELVYRIVEPPAEAQVKLKTDKKLAAKAAR